MPFSVDNFKSVTAYDVVFIIFMLLVMLTGYKLFKFWCALSGFACGAFLGYAISQRFSFNSAAMVAVIALLAVAAAAFGWAFYRAGVFLYVFSAAFTIGFKLFDIWWLAFALGLVLGIVAAILALKLLRAALIMLTAITGAYITSGLILKILAIDSRWVTLLLGVLLAVWGIVFQFITTAPRKEHAE